MRTKTTRNPRAAMLIVTASPVEAAYFSQMRKDCRYANLTVATVPATDLDSLIEGASKLRFAGRYDVVWAVFSPSALGVDPSALKSYKASAATKKVNLAWADPSITLYFALHFAVPSEDAGERALSQAVAEKLPGYKYDEAYILSGGADIHIQLFPDKAKAASNSAEFNRAYRAKKGEDGITYTALFNAITDVCGKADITHNQKLVGMK